jgi:hypothetical protein
VAQNDETIENLKRNRRQDKQIDRRDAVDVILEKRPPSLRRWPRTTAQDPGAAASAVLGRGSHRVHLRHRLPHTQMLRDELGPHEHVGLLAARGTWLLAVVLAAVRRMMTAH